MKKALRTVRTILLYPFSLLWEVIYIVRRVFYKYGILKRNHFAVPIISVGNLTFGGTGKTPFTIWLMEIFNEFHLKPMILTRGYKGNFEKSSGIIVGGEAFRNNPVDYGDEPLLIARRLKEGAVVVGKNRSKNLEYYFEQIRPDVILLDDGFQHLKLFQHFTVVLFDALLPIDLYRTAPLGYLREGLSALKDADAVVISRADQAPPEKINEIKKLISPHLNPKTPISEISYKATGIYNTHFEKLYDLDRLKGKKVVAVAAIASPDSFFKSLENLGAELVDKVIFPDHYYFTANDINELLVLATGHGAWLITSEKDIVKIRRISLDARILYIDIKVHFLKGEDELVSELKKVIK